MEKGNLFISYLRVTQHMSQQFRSHFGRMDLTFPQAMVLTVLGEDGPVPISTLAERTGSANSTVSGIVDRLEKLGLAKRQRSETDRRVIYVSATEKYTALRDKAATDVRSYFSTLMEHMTEEDRKLVATALQKLDEALSRVEEEKGNFLEKSFQELFTEYYAERKGVEPEEELLETLTEIIEKEREYETDLDKD